MTQNDFCNTIGTKRTSRHAKPMSAFGGKADIARCPLFLRKRTWIGTVMTSALCQKRTSQSLNRSQCWRHCVGNYSRERCEELQCDSRKATFGAANKAAAVSAECNLLVWNGIFMALFFGILQAT